MQGITVIDAVMIFIGPGKNDIASADRVNMIFHHKRDVAGEIQIDLTGIVNVGIVGVLGSL